MSRTKDPYYEWFGIPPKDQPPNHYRLLGLELFEESRDVISTAADRQMIFVKQYQTGVDAELSQQILRELTEARICLLKPDRKRVYDADLRTKLAGDTSAGPPPGSGAAAAVVRAVPMSKPSGRGQNDQPLQLDAVVPPPASGYSPRCTTARRPKPPLVSTPVLAALLVACGGFLAAILLIYARPGEHQRQSERARPAHAVPGTHRSNRRESVPTNEASPTLEQTVARVAPAPSQLTRQIETGQESMVTSGPSGATDDASGETRGHGAPETSSVADPALDQSVTTNELAVPFQSHRHAIPDSALVDEALTEVRTIYRPAIEAAQDRAAQATLVERILADASSESQSICVRYARYRMATDIATEAEDVEVLLVIVDEVAEYYEIDVLAAKGKLLREMAASDSWTTKRLAARRSLDLILPSFEAGKPDFARGFFHLADECAIVTRDAELVPMIRDRRDAVKALVDAFEVPGDATSEIEQRLSELRAIESRRRQANERNETAEFLVGFFVDLEQECKRIIELETSAQRASEYAKMLSEVDRGLQRQRLVFRFPISDVQPYREGRYSLKLGAPPELDEVTYVSRMGGVYEKMPEQKALALGKGTIFEARGTPRLGSADVNTSGLAPGVKRLLTFDIPHFNKRMGIYLTNFKGNLKVAEGSD